METITLDKNCPECCAIDVARHIENSLGSPLELPSCLTDHLSDQWAIESEDDLLALFKLMTGTQYEQKARDNTYNSENDLSKFFIFTVYAPVDSSDWAWSRDVFVVIEIGSGGDPRYCGYSDAKIYRLEDETIGDSGFLDWSLGWWAEPISDRYDREELDNFNDRISAGYSSSPFYEMENMLYHAPVWSEKRQSFVGRFKDSNFPVLLMPQEPYYGG